VRKDDVCRPPVEYEMFGNLGVRKASAERAESFVEFHSLLAELPPPLPVAFPIVFLPLWLHQCPDNAEEVRPLFGLLQSHLAKVDDVPLKAWAGVGVDLLTTDVAEDAFGILGVL
jgi:hypothetical protein